MALSRQTIEHHQVPVSPETINRLTEVIRRALVAEVEQVSAVEVEMALLFAYANVAPGVQSYPEASRSDRANLVVARGAKALVDVIIAVAKLPEQAVRSELLARQMVPSRTTH